MSVWTGSHATPLPGSVSFLRGARLRHMSTPPCKALDGGKAKPPGGKENGAASSRDR